MRRSLKFVYEYEEDSIKNILLEKFPNITDKQSKKFYNDYFYCPVNIALQDYENKLCIIEWNKSKDKHYYRVMTCRGYHKIVYMCKEQVEYFYGNKYEKI